MTGTPLWVAPELLSHKYFFNNKATDVYSFGFILHILYSQKNLYRGEDTAEVLKMITDPTICKRPLIPVSCPQQVQAIMNDYLKHEPKESPIFVDLDIRSMNLDVEKRHYVMI